MLDGFFEDDPTKLGYFLTTFWIREILNKFSEITMIYKAIDGIGMFGYDSASWILVPPTLWRQTVGFLSTFF